MPSEDRTTFDAAYAKVVAKAWDDEAFRARLLAEPASTLAAAGVALPPGIEVRVLEDTERLIHFVLPAKPEGLLSEQELDKVSGGHGANNMNCRGNKGTTGTMGGGR